MIKKVSTDNLSECTAQEVFDFVAIHLLTQNAKSQDSNGDCQYRGSLGLKCAAGCLISEEAYSRLLENRYWSTLVKRGHFCSNHEELIQKLQGLHDNYNNTPATWPRKLVELAEALTLSSEVVTDKDLYGVV